MRKIELYLSYIFIILTTYIAINYIHSLGGILLLSGLIIIIVTIFSKKYQQVKRVLKNYEDVANKLTTGTIVDYLAPTRLNEKENMSEAHNQLIRFVNEQTLETQQAKRLVKSVTSVIDAPLVMLSENGIIDYANESFLKIIKKDRIRQYSYEKIKNKNLRKLLQDALIREVYLKKSIEIDSHHYEVTAKPIISDDLEFCGLILLFHDVTALHTYQNLQREFFTNASHELKTPITAIKGCIDIIQSGTAGEKLEKEFLAIINKENLRLENLVRDLFLVNKFDIGQFELIKKEFSIDNLIYNVKTQVETLADLKEQKVDLDLTPNVFITADFNKIEQAILNLLTNAIHYSPNGTLIEIKMTQSEKFVKILLRDYGTGIPKSDLPFIFDRFYRVDKSRVRHAGGTGLGLSIVKAIIEAHSGTISIESIEEEGTTFTIKLPKFFI